MENYKEIKEKLKKRVNNVTGFTEDFYNMFLQDRNAIISSVISGSDNIAWENVKKSSFYNNYSCEYCEFLSVFYDSLLKYKVNYFTEKYPYYPVKSQNMAFENEEIANKYISAIIKGTEYSTFEILKTA